MRESGVRLRRNLGQNFLIDPNTLDKILAAASLGRDDIVLEIGAGIGALTEELSARAAGVVAVETDKRLLPILARTLGGLNNVSILEMDAMDLTGNETDPSGRPPTRIVANLPYGIAAPVVLRAFERFATIETMLVMVQKEIGDRMAGRPGSGDYSAFTVKLAYYCRVEKVMSVSRNSFMPPPNVDSSVVRLSRHGGLQRAPLSDESKARLFSVISAGFSQRRKRLSNALSSALPEFSKDRVEAELLTLGLPADARAETLSPDAFEKLSAKLAGMGKK